MNKNDESGEPPDNKPDDVGYGKPPAEQRFQKGKSGNPKGRPRKLRPSVLDANRAYHESILAMAYRPTKVIENGKKVTLSAKDVLLKKLYNSAMKDNSRAQLAILKMVEKASRAQQEEIEEMFRVFIEYKMRATAEMREHRRAGIRWEAPIPHPDDIMIDTVRSIIVFNGPRDACEKQKWDDWIGAKALYEGYIAEEREEQVTLVDDPEYFQVLERFIKKYQEYIDIINCHLPTEQTRRRPDFNIDVWRRKQPYYEKAQRRFREVIEEKRLESLKGQLSKRLKV